MIRNSNRRSGVVTTYTTCGELLAAVLEGTPDRRAAMKLLDRDSPLQRRLKRQILIVQ